MFVSVYFLEIWRRELECEILLSMHSPALLALYIRFCIEFVSELRRPQMREYNCPTDKATDATFEPFSPAALAITVIAVYFRTEGRTIMNEMTIMISASLFWKSNIHTLPYSAAMRSSVSPLRSEIQLIGLSCMQHSWFSRSKLETCARVMRTLYLLVPPCMIFRDCVQVRHN